MDLKEGQTVLNEILLVLEGADLDYSILQLKNESPSDGYTIEIKAFLGMVRKQQLGKIAEKYALRFYESPKGLTLIKS